MKYSLRDRKGRFRKCRHGDYVKVGSKSLMIWARRGRTLYFTDF